ncbi:MAG: TfoX/Sxy family protein [Pseudomonadota bacterium]
MAVSKAAIDQAMDLFAPLGEIRVRKMFGGAGVYCDELFFAILDDEAIYLKADDKTRATFEDAGLAAFSFEMKDGTAATMSYYEVPPDIFDDEEALLDWTGLALEAAKRTAAKKPKKKKAAKQ